MPETAGGAGIAVSGWRPAGTAPGRVTPVGGQFRLQSICRFLHRHHTKSFKFHRLFDQTFNKHGSPLRCSVSFATPKYLMRIMLFNYSTASPCTDSREEPIDYSSRKHPDRSKPASAAFALRNAANSLLNRSFPNFSAWRLNANGSN